MVENTYIIKHFKGNIIIESNPETISNWKIMGTFKISYKSYYPHTLKKNIYIDVIFCTLREVGCSPVGGI